MSVEQDSRLDPSLKVNIPQNNPFRRTNSPMNSPPLTGGRENLSNFNNPFLDPELVSTSPPKQATSPPLSPPDLGMRNLSLGNRPPPGAPPGPGQAASRLLQMKPGQAPPRRLPPGMDQKDPRGPPPQRRPDGRPEGERQIRSPSEERRRRERHERRKKEREAGIKDIKGKSVAAPGGGSSSKSKRHRGPHLDAIDKLDSTGSFLDPFGTGYHVSGPYDATVSRQSRKLRPIDAFAKDSLNMVMGGGKPLYDKHAHADARVLYGHVDDAVNDYTNAAVKPGPQSGAPYDPSPPPNRALQTFDATSKIEQVHGDETEGLGTSTFLEGTPAPASARRESESEERETGGISRTRSLAQRFRNQKGRERSNSSGIVTSPERRPPPPPPSGAARTLSPNGARPTSPPVAGGASLSGGGLDRINESKNPFFEDYDDAYERKGAAIQKAGVAVTLEDKGSRPENSASHQRTISNGSSGGEKERKDGFLGRMRSLRGRKKEKMNE